MPRFEQKIEMSGYLGKTKSNEILPDQRSFNALDKKSLSKELKEDSFAKASLLEFLADNLVGKLSLPENYKVIDEVIGEEGAAEELAKKIWQYGEKLGSKKIIPDNSAKEFMLNICNTLLPYVKKIRTKGAREEWIEAIREDFLNLKEYFNLIEHYSGFERSELSSKLGFLGGKLKDNELITLRGDKGQYIEKCKEVLLKNNRG